MLPLSQRLKLENGCLYRVARTACTRRTKLSHGLRVFASFRVPIAILNSIHRGNTIGPTGKRIIKSGFYKVFCRFPLDKLVKIFKIWVTIADVAELVDALDSGSSACKGMEVQVLSSALKIP